MHVVVNRYEKDQKDVLIHAEELLSVKMSGLIPNDYTTASEAMNHGKPLTLTASRKAISQWYLHGRGLLVGDKSEANGAGSPADKAKKATFLGRCFSSLGIDVVRKASMVSRG